MTEEQIDELVDERLRGMMRENAPKLLSYFVTICGRTCHETNADTLKLSVEATYDKQRYEVTTITKMKKIK